MLGKEIYIHMGKARSQIQLHQSIFNSLTQAKYIPKEQSKFVYRAHNSITIYQDTNNGDKYKYKIK